MICVTWESPALRGSSAGPRILQPGDHSLRRFGSLRLSTDGLKPLQHLFPVKKHSTILSPRFERFDPTGQCKMVVQKSSPPSIKCPNATEPAALLPSTESCNWGHAPAGSNRYHLEPMVNLSYYHDTKFHSKGHS